MFAVWLSSMSMKSSFAFSFTSACILVLPVKRTRWLTSTLPSFAMDNPERNTELSVASTTPAAVGQAGASKWWHSRPSASSRWMT